MDYDHPVSVPWGRLVAIAEAAGGQDCCACPPETEKCWLRRRLQPYVVMEPLEDAECQNCWIEYLMVGR